MLLTLFDVPFITISQGFSSLHCSFDLFLSNNICKADIPRVELYTYIVYLSFLISSYLYCILNILFSPHSNVVCWIDNSFFICRFYSGVVESFSGSSKKHKVTILTQALHVVPYAFFYSIDPHEV
jgi:hypothetical protein